MGKDKHIKQLIKEAVLSYEKGIYTKEEFRIMLIKIREDIDKELLKNDFNLLD